MPVLPCTGVLPLHYDSRKHLARPVRGSHRAPAAGEEEACQKLASVNHSTACTWLCDANWHETFMVGE